jgi:tyramine---L-glutamate ligase
LQDIPLKTWPIKKIFVCEFITGGGLCGEPLPDSLAKEGALMRDALLRDLSELPYEIITTIDARVKNDARQPQGLSPQNIPAEAGYSCVKPNIHAAYRAVPIKDNAWQVWQGLISECDAVLVIAPETDDVLLKFAQLTHDLGKVWLGCSLDAIEVTSNKLKTYEFLKAHDIPVPAFTWQQFCDYEEKQPNVLFAKGGKCVVKPIDGAGCEDTYVFGSLEKITKFMTPTNINNRQKTHIIQLFIEGTPASFVMLCANGKAHLLCCSRQNIQEKNNQLLFKGLEINGFAQHWQVFDTIAQYLASKMPGLHGLVGVDVVIGEKLMSVIEINPRITTSYVGLRRAMGVNPSQLLLESTENPNFQMPKIQKKLVTINV